MRMTPIISAVLAIISLPSTISGLCVSETDVYDLLKSLDRSYTYLMRDINLQNPAKIKQERSASLNDGGTLRIGRR
ncbi:hypothetical protein TWF506_003506 [Arthrobotrys conoides]|uniref:Uncharacterized protein n=1 Tax=Arthrobotrys conoides TaxID=74498 RepID=A0AAN8MXR2_9PEZI